MANFVKLIFTVVCAMCISTVFAQKPKPATTKPAAVKPGGFQKFTPPKLTSMLGIRSDSATVVLEEAVQLIKLPLKVTDDKKNVYSISSYQAMYKRRAVTEDEKTGKAVPTTSTVIENFRTTPLSSIWIKILTEQLRAGEEIDFFDIVVKDAQGRLMFAPELKIKVK
jgi:hypothetical protein